MTDKTRNTQADVNQQDPSHENGSAMQPTHYVVNEDAIELISSNAVQTVRGAESVSSPSEGLATVSENQAWRGPGLWGASLWMVVFLAVQVISSLATLLLLVVGYLWGNEQHSPDKLFDQLMILTSDPQYTLAFVGGTLLISTLINSSLIWWKLGKSGRTSLGFSHLPFSQAMCIVLMVLPISTISSKLYLVGENYWRELIRQFPQAIDLRELESMSAIAGVAENTSLPWMIFLFAVLPAVSEELIFRGFIGRGLTARWGRVLGVLFTTGFFVTMHGYPPHMLALIPISIMLHDVYLVTKSFWAPVLMHFSNNALAVIVMSHQIGSPAMNEEAKGLHSPALLWASLSCVLALAGLLRTLQRRNIEHSAVESPLPVDYSESLGSRESASEPATCDIDLRPASLKSGGSSLQQVLADLTLDRNRFRKWLAFSMISVVLFGLATAVSVPQ